MIFDDFSPHAVRLYEGCGKSDDLTPARLQAMFDRWGDTEPGAWKSAVDRLLTDPRWPTTERIDSAVAESEREAETVAARRQARGRPDPLGSVLSSAASRSTAWGASIGARIALAAARGATPAQCAKGLEKLAGADFDAHGVNCYRWHQALVLADKDWSKMPRGVAL